jgi:predicted nucleic acid-binding protein
MSPRKTFIDAGVLLAAYRGPIPLLLKANQILDDPDREFVSSPFLNLEILPKAKYFKNKNEIDFYNVFFDSVIEVINDLEVIVRNAQLHAETYGLAAIDALHVSAALIAKVDDFVTTEKSSKPMFRVTGLNVISIKD